MKVKAAMVLASILVGVAALPAQAQPGPAGAGLEVVNRPARAKALPYLTRPRATEALNEAMLKIHGPSLPDEPTGLLAVHRVERNEFEGQGSWVKEISSGIVEGCTLRMSARLESSTRLIVIADEPECRKTLTLG
jgi:hypothetical protein